MKRRLLPLLFFLFNSILIIGQGQLSVDQATISPSPLDPVEENGTGVFSFRVFELAAQEVPIAPNPGQITISLSNIDLIDGLNSVTGYSPYYVAAIGESAGNRQVYFQQAQPIPADAFFTISMDVKVMVNTFDDNPNNGGNVNLTPGSGQVVGVDFTEDFTFVNQPALPVELTSFIAEKDGDKALLNWTTATEINNDYFEVQRSTSGKAWETIGMVSGAGTTTLTQQYKFTDGGPYLGVNYYRLEQFDLDGSSEFSDVRKVNFEDGQDALAIKMYPNPTASQLRISANQLLDNHTMVVSDITGKILMNNDFVNGSEIDLQDFNPGMYLVRIYNQRGDAITTQRIIKTAN